MREIAHGRYPRDGIKWTREETILAMYLFEQIPFGQIHSHNPLICDMAKLLGRSPGSLSMKMCNIARLDPTLAARGVSGLANGGKTEIFVWDEFHNHIDMLLDEVSKVLANIKLDESSKGLRDILPIQETPLVQETGHLRADRQYFRSAVLASYDNTCCMTGIDDPSLLSASCIKPWDAFETKNPSMSPTNGLCLNALHAKAFEKGLFTIHTDFRIELSKAIADHISKAARRDYFDRYDGKIITLPHRFAPDKSFLEYHNQHVFVA